MYLAPKPGLALAAFAASSLATLPFGHYGPEGAVLFLNGFHFVSGHPDWEISANHFCAIIRDDLLQCAVYNTATTPARLAGIEYIITEDAFETLDHEERQLWHSHAYEITSGFLVEPGLPAPVDHAVMRDVLANTYGKTFHTWRYDQITPAFVARRDALFGTDTAAVRAARDDIRPNRVRDGADSWRYGFVLSLGLVNRSAEVPFSGNREQSPLQ